MLIDTKENNRSIFNSYSKLPDINMHNPYHSKGWSENQSAYNAKIQELIKEKFDDKPVNQQALLNKHLKNHCKNYYDLIKRV